MYGLLKVAEHIDAEGNGTGNPWNKHYANRNDWKTYLGESVEKNMAAAGYPGQGSRPGKGTSFQGGYKPGFGKAIMQSVRDAVRTSNATVPAKLDALHAAQEDFIEDASNFAHNPYGMDRMQVQGTGKTLGEVSQGWEPAKPRTFDANHNPTFGAPPLTTNKSANMHGLLKAAAGSTGPIPGPPGAPAAPATFYEPGPAAQDPVAHLGRRLGASGQAQQYARANNDRQELLGKVQDTQQAAATPEGRDFLRQLQSQGSSSVPSVWSSDTETDFGARPVYMKGVTQPGDTQRRQPAKLPFEAPANYKFNAITSPRQDTRADWVQAPYVPDGPLPDNAGKGAPGTWINRGYNTGRRVGEPIDYKGSKHTVMRLGRHAVPGATIGGIASRVLRNLPNMGSQPGL